MRACMCVRVYTYAPVIICVMFMGVHVHMQYVYACMCLHGHKCLRVCATTSMCLCVYLCVCVCVCVLPSLHSLNCTHRSLSDVSLSNTPAGTDVILFSLKLLRRHSKGSARQGDCLTRAFEARAMHVQSRMYMCTQVHI